MTSSGPSTSSSTALAWRRRATPARCRTSTVASMSGVLWTSRCARVALTSVPAGTSYAAVFPVRDTLPCTRESRKTRSALRSRSKPTTYHRPDDRTTPHGWRRRVAGSSPGPAVVEGDDATLLGGLPAGVEGRLLGAQAGRHEVEAAGVDLDALRGQLAHRLGGGARQRVLLPGAGRDAEHRGLVGLEADLRAATTCRARCGSPARRRSSCRASRPRSRPRARAGPPCPARRPSRTPRGHGGRRRTHRSGRAGCPAWRRTGSGRAA